MPAAPLGPAGSKPSITRQRRGSAWLTSPWTPPGCKAQTNPTLQGLQASPVSSAPRSLTPRGFSSPSVLPQDGRYPSLGCWQDSPGLGEPPAQPTVLPGLAPSLLLSRSSLARPVGPAGAEGGGGLYLCQGLLPGPVQALTGSGLVPSCHAEAPFHPMRPYRRALQCRLGEFLSIWLKGDREPPQQALTGGCGWNEGVCGWK